MERDDIHTEEYSISSETDSMEIDEVGSSSDQQQQQQQPQQQPSVVNEQGLTESQVSIRKQILEIQRDQSLPPVEKARKMQALMSLQYRKQQQQQQQSEESGNSGIRNASRLLDVAMNALSGRLQASVTTSSSESSSSAEEEPEEEEDFHSCNSEESTRCYTNAQSKTLGCKHYQRDCKIKAACCSKLFPCRFCHDEQSDHEINRHATTEMLCMHCSTLQPAAQNCSNCKSLMGLYYCEVCKLWDSDPAKSIYHCNQCGICRIGKGLGIDYFHCEKCGVCMSISLKDNHRCIERNLDSDCPICNDYLFTSTQTVIFMRCGHAIHWRCHQEHIKNSYQCPICWKSLADMKHYFQQIDRMLEQHKMPAEYEDFWSIILCNDCEQKSKTKYHFLYHKCQQCFSYNTKILNTVQEREDETANNGSEATVSQIHINTLGESNARQRSSSAVSSESRMFFDDNESRSRP